MTGTMLRRVLVDRRRSAMWWAIGMVSAVATIVGLWPSVKDQADLEDLASNLPQGVRALFGMEDGISLSSAAGYLQGRLFSLVLPVLLVVFAIGLGARTIGGAEEDGTLQLVVVAPVTRRRVALERLVAANVLVLGLTAIGFVTTVGVGAAVGVFDDVSVARTAIDTLAVAELALLFLSLAFAAGAATGRRGPALSVASAVAVGGYVLHGLAAAAPAIEPLRVLSPWWWFLDRNLLVHDPTFLSLGLPALLSIALVVYGVWAYERRDLSFP
jgi:ABC-2 type transport system permease protein